MRIEIVEESHNRVDWQSRTPLLWIEAGLLLGAAVTGALLLLSPSPLRWQITAAVVGVVAILGGVLAATMPPLDRGYLERLPEAGRLGRTKVWPLVGSRPVVEVDLGQITGFEVETEVFEESAAECYEMSRLWAVTEGEARYCLTGWAETESVTLLGMSLAKAGRLAFQGVMI